MIRLTHIIISKLIYAMFEIMTADKDVYGDKTRQITNK